MGSCVSSNNSRSKTYEYDKQPPQPLQPKNHNYSKFYFNITLANIKLKKCQYQNATVKFHIPDIFQYQLQGKNIKQNGQVKVQNYSNNKIFQWKAQKKSKFAMSQLQLRKNFLYIHIYNEQLKQVGKIKINLYIISTGPYHQDFLIEFKNKTNGRISFDFKIAQIVQIKIDSQRAQIDLIKKHPGEKFSFSIKPIMQDYHNHNINHQMNISMPSYTVMQLLDDTQQSKDVEQSMKDINNSSSPPKINLLRKKASSVKIKEPSLKIKTGNNLIWNKDSSLQLPSVNLKILSSDLHHSYFQIFIWKINDQNRQNQQQEEKLQYHAQCFIAFHKLISQEPKIEYIQGKKFQQREINISQKLWRFGRQCGTANFIFKIRNQVYMKQMPVCVRTQKGIQKLAPIFLSNDSKQSSSQKQIQKLNKINQQISSKMIEAQKLISEFSMYRQARNLQIQIQQGLEEMKQLLEKSVKSTIRIYEYSTPKQLLIAQETFLQIGTQIKDYLENQDHSINQICWLILIALLKRGQFTLAYIGFDQNQRKAIEKNKKNKLLERKICVAQKYQQFICQILKLAIHALNNQGMDLQKQFAEISCAYAYFRITQFRNELLESITKDNQVQINQWRGLEFMLDQDQDFTLIREQMNALSLLFDWDHCFYKYLQKKTDIQEILTVQECNNWKQRFSKRGIAFFKFIKRWVQYIQSTNPSGKGIQWRYCPGYNKILKAFFIQLKIRDIKQYPDTLKQAALKLLVNEKIVSPFITILFNKVNLYDTQSVAQVLQFISQMFETLQKRNKKIPALFNFSTFLKGIKLIFQSQASHSISAALILIYNHLMLFPLEFQRNISMFLLSKVFFKLFLHWQTNVRSLFYHLLIYRVLHEYKILSTENNQCQEQRTLKKQYNFQIRGRYQKLMSILKNAQVTQAKQQKKINKILEDKQLYLRMKKKFQRKRKKKGTQIRVQTDEQNLQTKQVDEFQYELSQKQTQTKQYTQHKFSIHQLQVPDIFEKANSDKTDNNCHKQMAKNTFDNFKSFKTSVFDQNQRGGRKATSFHFPNQVSDTTLLDQSNKQNKNYIKNYIQESYPNIKFFGKQQFDIKQLKPEKIHYLKQSMKMFNEILDIYTRNLNSKNKLQIPKIQMQKTMIDKKQIQPDKVEDW